MISLALQMTWKPWEFLLFEAHNAKLLKQERNQFENWIKIDIVNHSANRFSNAGAGRWDN